MRGRAERCPREHSEPCSSSVGLLPAARTAMTPLHFEQLYGAEWNELAALLERLHLRPGRRKQPVPGDRLAVLYRRACEHLALARARSYPAYIVDKLEEITSDAHQAIYQRRELGFGRLKQLAAVDFPRAV